MKRSIILEQFYPQSVEILWECLTNPDILKEWTIGAGGFKAERGFKWMETRPARPRMGWDGKMYFEVLEVIPFKKLAYSFKGGPREGVISLDSVVTWSLESKDGGTLLRLEHSGFDGVKNYFTSFVMELGWKKMLSKRLTMVLQKFFYDKK